MKRKIFLICALMCSLSVFAQTQFTQMYIFGDSLSDVGNKTPKDFALTDANIIYPSTSPEYKYSYEHRWSNGKVWNEYLAEMLNIDVPTNSENGGTNYAYGGGMSTTGTSGILGCLNIHSQITDTTNGFAALGKNFSESDLVCIWGGANNLFFSARTLLTKNETAYKNEAIQTAQEMANNISELIARGAKTIVVLNLPDVGATPSDVGDAEQSKLDTAFSVTFNEKLAEHLTQLKLSNPDVRIIDIDAYTIFNEILDGTSEYKFEYTTEKTSLDFYEEIEESGKYTTDGVCNYEEMLETEDLSNVLFWDDVHPSTAGHLAIADAVYAAIIPEPAQWAIILGILTLSVVIYRRK